jgi:hypothetical protein
MPRAQRHEGCICGVFHINNAFQFVFGDAIGETRAYICPN